MMNACMSISKTKCSPCPAAHSFLVGHKCTACLQRLKKPLFTLRAQMRHTSHYMHALARNMHCFQPLINMLSSHFHRLSTVAL